MNVPHCYHFQDAFLLKDVNDLKLNPAVGSDKCFNKTFSFQFQMRELNLYLFQRRR